MLRSLSTVLFAFAMTLPTVAAPPTPEEISKAVEDLASPRFAVRERASKLLWEAGKRAEDAVRAAAKSKDEETSNRAKAILEKFDWGLYPDTPAEIARLIERFRGGDKETRQATVGELIHLKPARFDVLRKVIANEQDDAARKEMYERMSFQARDAIPQLIVDGHLNDVNELLEVCLFPNNPASLGDYAAFQYLCKQLPQAITHFEELRKKASEHQRACEALVYLYRVKQDWGAARKAADDSTNTELQQSLAWEANDWKRLAASDGPAGNQEDRGAKAAYYRLAGDKAKYDEIIAELRKELAGVEGDDSAAFDLAYALLLNGEGAQAVEVLKGRNKRGSDLVFDLLCAQLKFKEAFAYADAALKELEADPMAEVERDQLAIRRAKMLASLGDRDGATQIFRQALTNALNGRRDRSAVEVVKAVARVGMRSLAAECAAAGLEYLRKTNQDYEASEFLDPVFEDKSTLVFAWWRAVRKADPKADPAVSMSRVMEFLEGKADRKKVDELAGHIDSLKEKITAKGDGTQDTIDLQMIGAGLRHFATAEAYRIAKVADKAEEFYKKALGAPAGVEDAAFLPDVDPGEVIVPTNYRYLLAYADFLFAQKRYKDAAVQYRKTWDAAPTQPLPLFLHGHALKLAGNDKEGARLMGLAHWVPLGNEVLRTKFSEDLFKRGFDADSRQEMDLILATGWFRTYYVGNVHLRMARIKARQHDYAGAARMYEKDVISLFRTGAAFIDAKAYLTVPELARTYKARALLAAGKVDEAMAEARAGLAVLPGNIELGLGFIPDLDKVGKKKEADELYSKIKTAFEGALKDYGNSADLRNSIAWTMVNCNRDLEDALKHAQKAVEVAPKTAGYIDTLAEVYFRRKDRVKALELMKECAALDPGSPYYRKQLERFATKPFDSPLPDEETGDDD